MPTQGEARTRAPLGVTHLRHVALTCPDWEDSVRFFEERWGLYLVDRQPNVAYFGTSTSEPYQLALLRGEERSIQRIALGVRDRAEVDAVASGVDLGGGRVVSGPGVLEGPGGGYGVRIADPDGRMIELSADVVARDAGMPVDQSTPLRLAHIVCNTPDIDRAEEFWRTVLGFRVSDWSEHQMVFMRCNAEHHSVAFNAADYASYNHTAWNMSSIDGLFRAQGRLRSLGTPLTWGTGRHAPGAQVFNYFIEPSGYVVELIADGVSVDDEASWEPKVWPRRPELMDTWGTSGPPSKEIRAAMAGSPDPSQRLAAATDPTPIR